MLTPPSVERTGFGTRGGQVRLYDEFVPKNVGREDVQRLTADGAQIIEVLPSEEYDELHIAGAVSIPLKELGERAPRELDRSTAVVTYCHDFL